jgi:hypothetical protein
VLRPVTEHYVTVPAPDPGRSLTFTRATVAAAFAGRGRLDPPYHVRVSVFLPAEARAWPAAYTDTWLTAAIEGLRVAGVIGRGSDVVRSEVAATVTSNPQRAHVQVRSLADQYRP